jgi:hypothetical protein
MHADYDVKLQLEIYTARFEVLTTVVVKSSIIFDITPCSPLKVNHTLKHPVRNSRNLHNLWTLKLGQRLGGVLLESRPGHRLSLRKYIVVLLSPSRKIPL